MDNAVPLTLGGGAGHSKAENCEYGGRLWIYGILYMLA